MHRPPKPLAVEAALEAGRRVTRGYGVLTAGLRPGPDFLLIGAKRGGTTSTYFHLLGHPDVLALFPAARFLPKQRDTKGIHYFDTGFEHGDRWYLSHFPSRAVRRRAARRAGITPVVGESSPYYLFHPLAAERAHGLVPDARILVSLRDPVERTFSHYREQVRNGVETLPFEAALAAEAERTAGEEARLVAEPGYQSFAHEHQSFAGQSVYAPSLRRWLGWYPEERVLVWASEEYYADPAATIGRICGFLGLAERDLPPIAPLNPAPPSQMPDDARAALVQRFAPDVAEVCSILGRRMPWPNFPG